MLEVIVEILFEGLFEVLFGGIFDSEAPAGREVSAGRSGRSSGVWQKPTQSQADLDVDFLRQLNCETYAINRDGYDGR